MDAATDDDFAAALDAALGGNSGVVLTGEKLNMQGGWAAGRSGHFRDPERKREATFSEDGKYNLTTISHTHEAVMNFMIAQPQLNLREVAAHFGYSPTWLSTLVHSDLFQARLREKQGIIMSGIAEDITSKLKAVADLGVEKLATHLEKSEDPRFILEATKTALTSLGFGAKNTPSPATINQQNIQQNFFQASPADLEAARGRITSGGAMGSIPAESSPAQVLAPDIQSIPAEGGLTLEASQPPQQGAAI